MSRFGDNLFNISNRKKVNELPRVVLKKLLKKRDKTRFEGLSNADIFDNEGDDIAKDLDTSLEKKLIKEEKKEEQITVGNGDESRNKETFEEKTNSNPESHNSVLKDQIAENSFTDAKNNVFGTVQLPSDLQSDSVVKTLGTDAFETHSHVKLNLEKNLLLHDLNIVDRLDELLTLLSLNNKVFATLSDKERNEVLDDILKTGLLKSFLRT